MSGTSIRAVRRTNSSSAGTSYRQSAPTFDPTRHRTAWTRYERANRAAHADYTGRHGLLPQAGYAEEQRRWAIQRMAARR